MQSANLRNLQIAQRNLRISRLEANLQTVTQSADCTSTQLFGVRVDVITSFDSNSGLDRCHIELKVVT